METESQLKVEALLQLPARAGSSSGTAEELNLQRCSTVHLQAQKQQPAGFVPIVLHRSAGISAHCHSKWEPAIEGGSQLDTGLPEAACPTRGQALGQNTLPILLGRTFLGKHPILSASCSTQISTIITHSTLYSAETPTQ